HRSRERGGEIIDINDFLKEKLARGQTDVGEAEVEDTLLANGITLDKDSEAYRRVAFAFLKASVKANQMMRLRQEGEVIDTPPAPNGTILARSNRCTGGEPLSKIFEKWKEERNPPAKTASEFAKAVRRFEELHGAVPAISITKPMVREFKEALRKTPAILSGKARQMTLPQVLARVERAPPQATLSIGSVNKDLGSLSAVLAWAGKNGFFDAVPTWANPAQGMKIEERSNADQKRLPYDADDLRLIFSSPVFTAASRPRAGGGEAAKWLPWLALYTGARLEELGQALVSDIREEGGLPYLDINTLDDGKKVKNASSRRKVPLHPTLVDLGFLIYVEQRRRAGGGRLFPELVPDQHGTVTGNWSKWWGRYARDLGVTDKRKVFHSFRHTVKDAFRNAGVEKSLRDAIMGHAAGDVADSYGAGYSLAIMAAAVAKLEFLPWSAGTELR
ncbi:MAG: site-specific integrase, partial [Clostridiaceae bacterium]|nr:site-specific integrase [Clostridiaceae bacterium]